MIIDTHLHPTNLVDEAWRHTGEPFTGERMLKLMDGPYMINGKPRRIDMGFIQPPPGNTGYRDGNRKGREGIRDYMAYCAELCQKYPDRFIGNFNYNPRWGPENGAAELEFHVKEYGFKMLKLHANMHGYRPDRALDWLRPAMKKCAELGVVVLIHTGDGPYTIPTMFYPIIREFPMVNFIIGHFGIQTGGNYSFEILLDGDGYPERLLRVRLVLPVAHRGVRPAAAEEQDRLRYGQPAERSGHVAARARSAVQGSAARHQPLRGRSGRLPRQQHRQARWHRSVAAAP